MATHSTKNVDATALWGGGQSPFSVSFGKLMMWFFLVSDALTFGGLIVALGYARTTWTGDWPLSENVFYHFPFAGHAVLPLLYVAFMTFILIVSSVTMVLAVEAGHRNDRKGVTKWLLLTVIGGVIFLGSQAWEWMTFIAGPDGDLSTWADNATLKQNFYGFTQNFDPHHAAETAVAGPVHYSQFFFFITGFHGFHVFSGVIINLLVLIGVVRGVYERRGHYEMVEKVGLYWHFVDLVWVFVFTFFYLL